jgi:hypothetical protein
VAAGVLLAEGVGELLAAALGEPLAVLPHAAMSSVMAIGRPATQREKYPAMGPSHFSEEVGVSVARLIV